MTLRDNTPKDTSRVASEQAVRSPVTSGQTTSRTRADVDVKEKRLVIKKTIKVRAKKVVAKVTAARRVSCADENRTLGDASQATISAAPEDKKQGFPDIREDGVARGVSASCGAVQNAASAQVPGARTPGVIGVPVASKTVEEARGGGAKRVITKRVGGVFVLDDSAARPNRKAGNLASGARLSRFSRSDRQRSDGFSGTQARANAGGVRRGEGRPFARDFSRGSTGGYRPAVRGPARPAGRVGSGPRGPAPLQVGAGKPAQNKRSFRGRKQQTYQYQHKDRLELEEKLLQQKKKNKEKLAAVPRSVEIMESVSVADLAKKMNLKASELIGKLFGMGMMVTMNQSIDADTATILASEYGCEVRIVSLYDETIIESVGDEHAVLRARPPVVTVMGHVDHGKTKTLDAIRSTRVAEGEFGGITQHIGAYAVSTPKGSITFLDTPGHEAFTMMRARGAEITDIVVLIVAADDGVMPQTIEAINHAKASKVPIIVAINKIDRADANPNKVMTRLAELGLAPEEWGGDTMYVSISALQGIGLDLLLDAIMLQAEVMELRANYGCCAEGRIIESRIDHGRGIVASVIVRRGVLRVGDTYVAGVYSGRVRAIFNDQGEKIQEATPSMPVEILGLEGMPNAGDPFQVTDSERIARQISLKRQELRRYENARNVKRITLDKLYESIEKGSVSEFKVIIKGDVQGSVEALKQSLEKLSTDEVQLRVIHSSVGAINDSDVMLAAADSNVTIVGFNVRPTPQAAVLAERERVEIKKYTVIYQAVEEMERAMEGMLKPSLKEVVLGSAEVRKVFKIPKVGSVAGVYVLEGVMKRNAIVHVVRDGIVLHSGKVSSLRREKDDVKEVHSGFECGVGVENYFDFRERDRLECAEMKEVSRKLKDAALSDAARLQG